MRCLSQIRHGRIAKIPDYHCGRVHNDSFSVRYETVLSLRGGDVKTLITTNARALSVTEF